MSYQWVSSDVGIDYRNYLFLNTLNPPDGLEQQAATNYFGKKSFVKRSFDFGTSNFVSVASEYDAMGRLFKTYFPREDDNLNIVKGVVRSEIEYDYQGRKKKVTEFNIDGSEANRMTYSYLFDSDPSQRTLTTDVTHTKPNGVHVTSTLEDGRGRVLSSSDNLSEVSYSYNIWGESMKITPNNGEPILLEYDDFGMQKKLVDPDFGVMEYENNAFGELVSQSDESHPYSMVYDNLGRMVEKVGINGDLRETEYITEGNNKGRVADLKTAENSNEHFEYDRFGNVVEYSQTINGVDYKFESEFDKLNRPIKERSAAGVELEYVYDENNGALTQIRFGEKILWEIEEMNKFGSIVESKRNNGAFIDEQVYSSSGKLLALRTKTQLGIYLSNWEYDFEDESMNLLSRTNGLKPEGNSFRTEYFSYDVLDRLTEVRFDSENADPALQMTYDASGNIVYKSDVTNGGEIRYGENNYGPHAVTSISAPTDVVLPSAINQVDYNAFHQPEQILQGEQAYDLHYGHDDQRRVMSMQLGNWTDGGLEISEKLYLGNEEWLKSGDTYHYRHFVSGPTGLVAIITGEVGNEESTEIYYPVTDYLGSILIILDENGEVVEERSYDAWGRLRNPNNWYEYEVTELAVTNRGYTFHEHILDAGLINMNGRLYDPVLARMLSPDNYVQSSGNPQNYNRYSYVLNNPLKYTDPEGEFIVPALIIAGLVLTDVGYDIQKYVLPVAVHVDLNFGTHTRGLGLDVSIGIPQAAPLTYRYEVGATYYEKRVGGYGHGWQVRNGGEWSVFGVAKYGGMRYRDYDGDGEIVADQVNQTYTLGPPLFNLSFTNDTDDAFPFHDKIPGIPKLGDSNIPGYGSSDRLRTASGKVRFGLFEVGFFLHTGEATEITDDGTTTFFDGGSIGDPRRSNGIAYIGFGPLRIGRDSEDIRHFLQNRVAHDGWSRQPLNGDQYAWVLRTQVCYARRGGPCQMRDRRSRWVFQFGGF